MKKRLFNTLISLVSVVAVSIGSGMAQEIPLCKTRALLGPEGPDICVSVVLGDVSGEDVLIPRTSFLLGEPIKVVISLENVGNKDIFTSQGFSDKDFRLLLHFTYTRPDGKKELITANLPTPTHEPPPPRVKLIKRKLAQVEGVEVLSGPPTRWVWTLDPFNAPDFYSLDRVGKYSVATFIAMRTYPASAVQTSSEAYARLNTSDWSGVLESNAVKFSIVGDVDGDGYCYPEFLETCQYSEVDCDDSNPNVHPNATEITGNGIDDDCDPTTLDGASPCEVIVKVDKHVVGGGSHPGSSKYPLDLVEVKAFDKLDPCVQSFGVSWHHYKDVYKNCAPLPVADVLVGSGVTGSAGTPGICNLSLPIGECLIIGEYDPDRYLDPPPEENTIGNEMYIGTSGGPFEPGETVHKYLQIIEKVDGKKVPGKYKK